jgi:hypothetical protein
MSYTLQVKISDETAELLRAQAGDKTLSEFVRPMIEDLAQGVIHLPDPEAPKRITPAEKDPSGCLTSEAIKEMVRKNEAKGLVRLEPHVLRPSPTPFKTLPWDHDDHLRPRINMFRRRLDDRNACLKMLGKGRKALEA